jgi:hypothetical protein
MADAEMTQEQKSKIEVFVSYAKEDRQLVLEIAEALKKPFSPFQLHFFIDDRSIEEGDEWRDKINDALDAADILLIVATGQKKESHSFTGYEIGYFSKSVKARPMARTVKRRVVPLIFGDKLPIAVSEIQGINVAVKPGDLSSEERFMQIFSGRNPFRNLLSLFRDMIIELQGTRLSNSDMEDWNRNIDDCAIGLYKRIFGYLRGSIFLEKYPERKLIIRTASPPGPPEDDSTLDKCTIDFVGESFDMFSFQQRPTKLPWREFVQAISPAELATQWEEGIRSLVSDALTGIPVENYAFVRSSELGPAYRLFVSLVRTYYSEQREIHIYIVEVAPTQEYGDTATTKLAKAVDLGLRYRSLFLEGITSPFSPQKLSWSTSKEQLRSIVKNMWRELQHLLAEARQSHLDDPELLVAIYGPEGHKHVDDLTALWFVAEDGLSKLTHEVMAAPDEKIMAMKPAVMASLKEFCDRTEQMNQEFTASALRALNAKLTSNVAAPVPAEAARR